MSEKLQGFILFLPTIGGQDAVDVLLDGIVFPHMFFQASVLSVQPILFFEQSGIFLAQLGKVGELITDARRFQRPSRRFKENDFPLTSAQILFLVTGFFVSLPVPRQSQERAAQYSAFGLPFAHRPFRSE